VYILGEELFCAIHFIADFSISNSTCEWPINLNHHL